MSRFQILISSQRVGDVPTVRRVALGRLGTAILAALLTLLAAIVIVFALVLGYIVAGLIVVALLIVLFAALVRGAFWLPGVKGWQCGLWKNHSCRCAPQIFHPARPRGNYELRPIAVAP